MCMIETLFFLPKYMLAIISTELSVKINSFRPLPRKWHYLCQQALLPIRVNTLSQRDVKYKNRYINMYN